jgi:chromosome partitioning protein
MTVVYSISNQKGGVGKTTTAVTIAHGLALAGQKTLLIDMDSQGNVAEALGMSPGRELARLLNPVIPEPLETLVQPSGRPNLDVIRSDSTTATLKVTLAGIDFRESLLAKALDDIPYDVVILDCAPSLDILHTMALVAADWLLIPTKLDQFAVKGVKDILISLKTLRAGKHTRCGLTGVLPTFYDRTIKETHVQLQNLAGQFQRYLLPPIPQDAQSAVANRLGKTLYEHIPAKRSLCGVDIDATGRPVGGYKQTLERVAQAL